MGIFAGGKAARASGGTVSTAGPYTVHQFTSTSTFTPAVTGFVDILLVGGGGNSGMPAPTGPTGWSGGGGGGATLFKKMIAVTAGTPYPITLGPSTPTTFTYSGITTTAFHGAAGGSGGGGAGVSSSFASGGGGGRASTGGTAPSVYGIGYPGGSTGDPATGCAGGGAGGAGGNYPGTLERGAGVPITYFTGVSPDIVGQGGRNGPAYDGPGGYGAGGSSPAALTVGPGQPGVAYIRYM